MRVAVGTLLAWQDGRLIAGLTIEQYLEELLLGSDLAAPAAAGELEKLGFGRAYHTDTQRLPRRPSADLSLLRRHADAARLMSPPSPETHPGKPTDQGR